MNDLMMALHKKRMDSRGDEYAEKPVEEKPEEIQKPEGEGLTSINAKLDMILKHLGIGEEGTQEV